MSRAPPLPRRADWHLLLPSPPPGGYEHLVLLGGPAGLGDRLLDIGWAKRVSRGLRPGEPADALAVLDGPRDGGDLRRLALAAARLLSGGGVYYCEIDRRKPGWRSASPRRVRRILQASGLRSTGAYLVRPSFEMPQTYLPLEPPDALHWYLGAFHLGRSRAQRERAALLARLWRAAPRLVSELFPAYAITAITGSAPAPACAVLDRAGFGGPESGHGARPIIISIGRDEVAHLVLLPFPVVGASPQVVLKMPRAPARNPDIENEQAVLRAVRDRLDPSAAHALPQALGTFRHGALAVASQSFIAGRTLAAQLNTGAGRRRRALQALRDTAAWLSDFHLQAVVQRGPWDGAAMERWVETPLAEYTGAFGANESELALFRSVRAAAIALAGTSVPLVWQHRGLHLRNVIRDAQRIRVLDWEYAEPGLPLMDLLYFTIQWTNETLGLVDAPSRVSGFRQVFVEPRRSSESTRAVHEAIEAYRSRLGLQPEWLNLLLTLTCVSYALKHFHYTAGRAGPGADPRRGNLYVRLLGALAEGGGSSSSAEAGSMQDPDRGCAAPEGRL